jgi:hypothetical protein
MSAKWSWVAAAVAALVIVPAALSGAISYRDSAGDVKGGPGPDIRSVSAVAQKGRLSFRITFAKAPPLMYSTKRGFTDMLLVTVWTTRSTSTKAPHYWLGVHGADLKHVPLVNALTKKMVWLEPSVVLGKSVTLSVNASQVGNPRMIKFSVAAGREMNEGAGGGSDVAPDKGTLSLLVRS